MSTEDKLCFGLVESEVGLLQYIQSDRQNSTQQNTTAWSFGLKSLQYNERHEFKLLNQFKHK